jgi:hypothetical protein
MKRPTILISGCTEKRGVEFDDLSLSLALRILGTEDGGAMPGCRRAFQTGISSLRRCDAAMAFAHGRGRC